MGSWRPLTVALAGIVATVALWRALERQEQRHVVLMSRTHARSVAEALRRVTRGQIEAFARVAGRVGPSLREPRD